MPPIGVLLKRKNLRIEALAATKHGVVPQTAVIFLLVFNVILELVQGHERGILGPMKDSNIAVYKSFLLKLSYGAPGWPVSRFRPGTLVFILPDFGRDMGDLSA